MKTLLMTAALLTVLFGSTFVLISATGAITADRIEEWLSAATSINPWYVAVVVITLLFADLFVAVPTLTISILSGYLLGPVLGSFSAAVGMLLAGSAGYAISRLYGPTLLLRIYKDTKKLQEMKEAFAVHGTTMILLSRAVPILPEVSCCLAGATGMPVQRFMASYAAATIPYAVIAAYAGSHSSLTYPQPAILTAIAISVSLWLAWFYFLHLRTVGAQQTRQRHTRKP